MSGPGSGADAAGLVEIAGALRAMLPAAVSAAVLDPAVPRTGLMPSEAAALAPMIERRRREFTAGRLAARAGMAALGLPPAAVPMGADRAPVWPAGVVGAITHSPSFAAAAVARSHDFRALGIDIEPEDGLAGGLVASFCGPAERAWLARQPAESRPRLATMIFSAKECAYKCQYPLTGRMLGFEAFRVEADPAAGRFRAILTAPVGPFAGGDAFEGRIDFVRGHVLTVIALAARTDHAS